MSIVPNIHGSAQARLKLYQLISTKLTKVQQEFLEANPSLWERIILELENSLNSNSLEKFDEMILSQAFLCIEKTSIDGLQRQMKFLTGKEVWIGKHPTQLLNLFIDEHRQIIKSIQTEQLNRISLSVKRGIRDGRMSKDTAKEIRETTGINKARARLIARNSVLNYCGALTKHNQMSAGIKSYIWQSSGDERVRDAHRKLDGKIFNWEGPGPHPKTEVNCRCDAIPVLD